MPISADCTDIVSPVPERVLLWSIRLGDIALINISRYVWNATVRK